MKTLNDINGNPVRENRWYWATDEAGKVRGAGMFILTQEQATFFINGTAYNPETFADFAWCGNPDTKFSENFKLFQTANMAIGKCARRIAKLHDPYIAQHLDGDEYYLRSRYHLLKQLFGYLESSDGTQKSDQWIADVLRDIENAIEIYKDVDCPTCKRPVKAEVCCWRGDKSIGGRCTLCKTMIQWDWWKPEESPSNE